MNVNLPTFLKTPKALLETKEGRTYFAELEFILFQMWKRMGGSTDLIADAARYIPSNNADIISLNQRIGSGDFLTCDETGFTVDLETLTVDMDETIPRNL